MTQKPITIKDIAEKLNISVSTVSRALKDNHEISAQTRKTVQELAKQLGYKPNPIAVALKTHKSHSIGVIVPQIVSTFFATVVKTIEEVADGHGYKTLKFPRPTGQMELSLPYHTRQKTMNTLK